MSIEEAVAKLKQERKAEEEACAQMMATYPDLVDAIGTCNSVRAKESKPCNRCFGSGKASEDLEKFGITECIKCEGSGKIEPFTPRVILGTDINHKMIRSEELMGDTRCGDWVAVRPCDDEYNNKTFLGVYLGDLPIDVVVLADRRTHKLQIGPHGNPAMYVPDIKKIIFGCGSWWHKIEKPSDLDQITNKDINDTWYVKALADLGKDTGNA